MDWYATYGKLPSESRFAIFKESTNIYEKYAGIKEKLTNENAAETEYVHHSLEMINMHSDIICAESSVMIDQFGGERWMPQLHKDASDAYRLWYHKHHKEPSNESSLLSS